MKRRLRSLWRWLWRGEVDDFIVGVPYSAGPVYLSAEAVGRDNALQAERLDVALRHLEVALAHIRAAREALGT